MNPKKPHHQQTLQTVCDNNELNDISVINPNTNNIMNSLADNTIEFTLRSQDNNNQFFQPNQQE
jgi:hypothetical protein